MRLSHNQQTRPYHESDLPQNLSLGRTSLFSSSSSFMQGSRPLSPSVRTTVFVGSHHDWARGGRGEEEVHSILLVPWERLKGVRITLSILNILILVQIWGSGLPWKRLTQVVPCLCGAYGESSGVHVTVLVYCLWTKVKYLHNQSLYLYLWVFFCSIWMLFISGS